MLRSPSLLLLLLLLLPPGTARAGSSPRERRAEAEAAVGQVVAGQGVHAALARLRYLGEEAWGAARLAREAHAPEVQVRRDVAQALSLLATAREESTLEALSRDGDGAVRMFAAQGLGRLHSRRTEVLLPLLADASSGVRREAARALGHTRRPRMALHLVRAARAEPEPEVRAALLVAVGQLGARGQRRALTGFLDSSSESTRLAAARALCLLGAPEGAAFARARLAAGDVHERRLVLQLLEGVARRHAEPLLRPLLKEGDLPLAAGAARLLAQAGDASMRGWLVLASHRAGPGQRAPFERELEVLGVRDEERRAVLAQAGLR